MFRLVFYAAVSSSRNEGSSFDISDYVESRFCKDWDSVRTNEPRRGCSPRLLISDRRKKNNFFPLQTKECVAWLFNSMVTPFVNWVEGLEGAGRKT